MADDVFSLFRTPDTSAAQADTKPADSSDVFRMFQSDASQTKKQSDKPAPPPLPSVSEYGDLGNAWWNMQANPPGYVAPPAPAAPTLPGPGVPSADVQSADTGLPLPQSPPPNLPQGGSNLANALQPAPNTTYGSILPIARDDKTGEIRYGVLPSLPREMLQGTVQGIRDIFSGNVGAETTVDPATGKIQYGMTPGANLLLGVGARPLAFSGPHPLMPEVPGTFSGPIPTTVPELTAAVQRAGETTPRMAAELEARLRANALTPDAQPAPPSAGPAATPAEVAANTAWVGKTIDQVGNIVQENAAQGGPASLGAAATPEQLAAMSPEMAKAYRRMAEVNRVVSPIEGEDTSIKVPGSVPTEAEAKGDPVTSTREVMTRQYRPEAFEGPQGRLTQNNTARLQMYDDMTPSDPQIATLKEDQAKQAQADETKVYQNAGPVDGMPVAAQLKQLMANPRIAEQPDVMKVLQPIHDALYDADGNLKTDIASYWGMHDNLMNRLAKAKDPLQASSSEKFAFNQLLDAKNAVDGAMDKASGDAFQTFLDNQSQFFQQQNAATILRDFRSKMTNPNTGMIQPNAFHRFVTDLAVRRGRPGIDPAMDIPDETMGNLMNIDDDLKRAGRIDLGKPRGSPTNLYFELANGLGIVGAHSAVHLMGGGPIANLALQSGINAAKQRVARMRTNALVDRALNYPPAGPPPNPNPPGAFVPPNQLQFPPPP